MNINEILQQVDECYAQNRGEDAEEIMLRGIELATRERNDEALLQLLNELLGYYRETGRVEESYILADRAVAQAENMGLTGTLPYATTLLNVANAYRAGGRLQESLDCYTQVSRVYEEILTPDNMLVASLENNRSLLYQEMGDYVRAKESLLNALAIVKAKDAEFEVAVSRANLAATCMQLGQQEEAYAYGQSAVTEFERLGVKDAHYGAALSALGTYYYENKNYAEAESYFCKAMDIMEENLGRNEYFYRLQDNVRACGQALATVSAEAVEQNTQGTEYVETINGNGNINGLALCREYYETYGRPMLEQKFPEYVNRIAVGLVGEGSDCFGYDDEFSRDHDWGPDFCIWVTEDVYTQIGEALERAYESLPNEFKGYKRTYSAKGVGRRGVMTISDFYRRLVQTSRWEEIDWKQVGDFALATAVNGEVFRDDEGVFTALREKLQEGYPASVRLLKIAEGMARFSQCGQYNYFRMLAREDDLTAQLMLMDAIKEAMKLQHYIENRYPPHDKWLRRSLRETENGECLDGLLEELIGLTVKMPTCAEKIEQIAAFFAKELYEAHIISDSESYLDVHTEELIYKASKIDLGREELVDEIVKLEFAAFDKVKNVGGRAFCQNDWSTFSIMRKSQYLTWNRTMLLQYLYDFDREFCKGHNLIEEKYGRMMESTAPDEYEKIKEYFPVLTDEKKAIISQIAQVQVAWMEEFAERYPHLADNARSIRSAEDNLYNTSYETYLCGELGTYSDKMLELYGKYVVEYAKASKNLAFEIMKNSVHLYGYKDLDAAERFLSL